MKSAYNWLLVPCAQGFRGLGWRPNLLAESCQRCSRAAHKEKAGAADAPPPKRRPGAPPVQPVQPAAAAAAPPPPPSPQPLFRTYPLQLDGVWESARTQQAPKPGLKPAYVAPEPALVAAAAPALAGATHAPPSSHAQS